MANFNPTPEQMAEVEQSGGTKEIVISAEGAAVRDVPQSVVEMREQVEEKEAAKVASADSILGILQTDDAILVELRDIEVGDETISHAIRVLPYNECSRIDAKRYRRKPNGQIEFSNDYAETVGVGWQIFECVMVDRNAGKVGEDGKPLKPDWKRMFTLEQILGDAKNSGLMGNPNPAAKDYVYNLCGAIWAVNIELNPAFTRSVAESLGSQ